MTLKEAMSTRPDDVGHAGARKASAEDITFLMVGCQRCGSTWLYEALKEHPEVFVPASKQTHYFDEPADKNLDWYLRHFDDLEPKHKAVGEVATGYCLPTAIPLMARDFPDIKIIMAMRNPPDRAFSYYRSRAPNEDWRNFDDALDKNPGLISRGQYIDQIELLLKFYDRHNMLFLFYDDLKKNEREYLKVVYDFLGVDPTFEPSVIGNPVRAAMFPRLRRLLRRLGLTPIVDLINTSWVGDVIRRVVGKKRKNHKVTQKIPADIRQKLQAHFHPYNERLAKFSGRDLSNWSS